MASMSGFDGGGTPDGVIREVLEAGERDGGGVGQPVPLAQHRGHRLDTQEFAADTAHRLGVRLRHEHGVVSAVDVHVDQAGLRVPRPGPGAFVGDA